MPEDVDKVAKRVGANIRRYRLERGLSQEQLGQMLGVPQTTVSRWERGDGLEQLAKLMLIAEAVEVSPARLLGVPLNAQRLGDYSTTQIVADLYRRLGPEA